MDPGNLSFKLFGTKRGLYTLHVGLAGFFQTAKSAWVHAFEEEYLYLIFFKGSGVHYHWEIIQ
jgi:hypothetical protein